MHKYEAKITEIYNQILVIRKAFDAIITQSYGFAYPCLRALHHCLKARLCDLAFAINDANNEFKNQEKPEWLIEGTKALEDFEHLYKLFEPKEEYLKTWKNPLKETNLKVKKRLS